MYVRATERQAEDILDLLTIAFGEEDIALATQEIDERNDIWEASIYLMAADEDDVRARFVEAIAEAYAGFPVEKEIIPDADWIAMSLEGLKPVRAGRFIVHGSHDRDKVRANDLAIEIDIDLHSSKRFKRASTSRKAIMDVVVFGNGGRLIHTYFALTMISAGVLLTSPSSVTARTFNT